MLFKNKLQERIAYLAISRSSLRNQGESGIIAKSRTFSAKLNLNVFAKNWNNLTYSGYLDVKSETLSKNFRNKKFGAARKALNLFFRDVVYNTFLVKEYKIKITFKHLKQLEIPLDSYTTKEIFKKFPFLKKWWGGIIYLNKEINDWFQEAASRIAVKQNLPKVHLDVFYWRKGV